MNIKNISLIGLAAAVVLGSSIACNGGEKTGNGTTGGGSGGGGEQITLAIDGSSTVFPIIEAMVEEYRKGHDNIEFEVAFSGTGGGFKKFNANETDISMASRPIKQEEIDAAKAAGIEYIEIPVAFDGLTVVINPNNNFAGDLTVEELNKIWMPDSTVKTWADVRAGFPAQEIKLYGPGTDSGTFDYFTEAINGESGVSRADYQANEDDNVLVQGVAGDEFALGYFGYSYYIENTGKLKAVNVNGVGPTEQKILDGTYTPLSRPLFLYINKKSLEEKPAIKDFIAYIFGEGQPLIKEVGYVSLPTEVNDLAMKHVEEMSTGTRFQDAKPGMNIKEVIEREGA